MYVRLGRVCCIGYFVVMIGFVGFVFINLFVWCGS